MAALLVGARAPAQTRDIGAHGELLDRIAAIVNDGLVLKSELDEQMEAVTKRLQEQKVELPPESVLRQQVLERLILQEIETQRAKHVGLTISDEQLERRAARDRPAQQDPVRPAADRARRPGRRLQAVPREHAQGAHLEHPQAARRDRPHQRLSARARSVSRAPDNRPRRTTSSTSRTSFCRCRRPPRPQQLEDITKKANDIAARASKGEDFGQLAIANSNSQTALDGGQLGWRKGSQLPQFILDLVTKMKPGDVSTPVRTPSGFHIVKLNERAWR